MMILQRDLTESLGHRVWWFKFSCLGNLSLVNWHPSRDSIAKLAMERAIRASIGSVRAGLAKALPASAHSWHDPNLVQDPTLNNWSLSYHPKPWIKNAYAKPYEWKMQERPPNCRKGQIVSAVDRSLNCQQHLFANLRNICQPWMFVDRILESPLVAHLQGMYKPCGMMGRSYLSEGSEFQFLYFVFCLVECSAWGRCFGLKPKTRPSSELLQQSLVLYMYFYIGFVSCSSSRRKWCNKPHPPFLVNKENEKGKASMGSVAAYIWPNDTKPELSFISRGISNQASWDLIHLRSKELKSLVHLLITGGG